MSFSTAIAIRRYVFRSIVLQPSRRTTRSDSTKVSRPALEISLYDRLRQRGIPKIYDKLHPKSSNDLSALIDEYLPAGFRIGALRAVNEEVKIGESCVLEGHHQVYFNKLYPEKELLPDGTDKIHYPGGPFTQRLWAGGSLTFNPREGHKLKHGHLGVLQEDIEDVKIKGQEGEEKVFVTVSRKMASCHTIPGESLGNQPDLRKVKGVDLQKRELGKLAMEEKKTLVFMRPPTKEQVEANLQKVPRIIKPIHKPDISHTITPTPHLLSCFSQLTSNGHRIHLDPSYARETEGHRNLLVHGPLSQILMLSLLKSQLRKPPQHPKETIIHFDYKNLAPLYVNEPMTICIRRNPEQQWRFDVWITGKEGGYAVKATAEVWDPERAKSLLLEKQKGKKFKGKRLSRTQRFLKARGYDITARRPERLESPVRCVQSSVPPLSSARPLPSRGVDSEKIRTKEAKSKAGQDPEVKSGGPTVRRVIARVMSGMAKKIQAMKAWEDSRKVD